MKQLVEFYDDSLHAFPLRKESADYKSEGERLFCLCRLIVVRYIVYVRLPETEGSDINFSELATSILRSH